jgi:hypothetical protein
MNLINADFAEIEIRLLAAISNIHTIYQGGTLSDIKETPEQRIDELAYQLKHTVACAQVDKATWKRSAEARFKEIQELKKQLETYKHPGVYVYPVGLDSQISIDTSNPNQIAEWITRLNEDVTSLRKDLRAVDERRVKTEKEVTSLKKDLELARTDNFVNAVKVQRGLYYDFNRKAYWDVPALIEERTRLYNENVDLRALNASGSVEYNYVVKQRDRFKTALEKILKYAEPYRGPVHTFITSILDPSQEAPKEIK